MLRSYLYYCKCQITISPFHVKCKSIFSTKNDSVHALRVFSVSVHSHGKSWVVRRSYENFEFLDRQAHQCIFDRKYSQLPVIPQEENVTPNNGQSHKVG